MTKLQTINSSKDIPEYNDKRIELLDQLEVVKTWYNVETEEELLSILEEAQNYLAATYNEIFQDSRF